MIKRVSIKCLDWSKDIEIDDDIFDDVFLEACTQSLEKNLKNGNMKVAPFMEANLNKSKKIYIFNTYKILINAGFYTYAENLRENFKRVSSVDLQKEPIKST